MVPSERNGLQYEKMVLSTVVEQIRNKWPHSKFEITHNKKFISQSGDEYAVDIAIEFELLESNMLIAVECKDHTRPVERKVVDEFATRLRRIGANKGIIVSANGFQKGAHISAKECRISLAKVVDYIYTPYAGDPAMFQIYLNNVYGYLGSLGVDAFDATIANYFNYFRFYFGNAYRALKTVPLESVSKSQKEEQYDTGSAYEVGFVLETDEQAMIIDGHDLFLLLIGESLLNHRKHKEL